MFARHDDANDVTKTPTSHCSCTRRQATEVSCRHTFLANFMGFVDLNELFFVCKLSSQPIIYSVDTLEALHFIPNGWKKRLSLS